MTNQYLSDNKPVIITAKYKGPERRTGQKADTRARRRKTDIYFGSGVESYGG